MVCGVATASVLSLEGEWRIEAIKDVKSFDTSKANVAFANDGSMAMTIGCNRMRSKPKIEGSSITIGPIAGTMMICPPLLADLEQKLQIALDTTRTFKLDGATNTLTFLDEVGANVLTLVKTN